MKETTAVRTKRETMEVRRQLKIGEVAKLSGIGIEALRFYEKSGLLGRPGRTQSGYRVYDSGRTTACGRHSYRYNSGYFRVSE
jgi:hypothetical protein